MRDLSHRLKRSFWRKRGYPLLTRYVIRPTIDLLARPLVAVTGSSGKTSVTLLIERILQDAGYKTASACTEGVRVDGRWIRRGDHSGPKGLWHASRSFGVEAVVAETARGGILMAGLGFSHCDVSVVTNVEADHMGLLGIDTVEQMAEVKSIVPRSTHRNGTAVLNFDQHLVRDMARRTAARVVFFSMSEPPDSVEDCFYLDGERVVRKRGATREPLLHVDRIQLTHGGVFRYQIANAMAAMAAVEALQAKLPVSRLSLERSLSEFGREQTDLPMRFQLMRYQGVDVLLSATKNPRNYEIEVPLMRRLARAHGYKRIVCVISEVGNRKDEVYHAAGRAAAAVGDAVVCVAPASHYLRGRSAEEIIERLAHDVPPDKLVRPSVLTLEGVFDHFKDTGPERTLFIAFASVFYGDIVRTIVARGQSIPLRF